MLHVHGEIYIDIKAFASARKLRKPISNPLLCQNCVKTSIASFAVPKLLTSRWLGD